MSISSNNRQTTLIGWFKGKIPHYPGSTRFNRGQWKLEWEWCAMWSNFHNTGTVPCGWDVLLGCFHYCSRKWLPDGFAWSINASMKLSFAIQANWTFVSWPVCWFKYWIFSPLPTWMWNEILNSMVRRRCWRAWLHFKSAYIIFRLFAYVFLYFIKCSPAFLRPFPRHGQLFRRGRRQLFVRAGSQRWRSSWPGQWQIEAHKTKPFCHEENLLISSVF